MELKFLIERATKVRMDALNRIREWLYEMVKVTQGK